MSFLVPQPIARQTTRKQSCVQTVDNRCIFDKIRDLCQIPKPPVKPLDERLFVSSIFDDIRELCRRPELLTGIEDQEIEDQSESVEEEKVYIKRDIKSKYYSDSENKTFDEIRQNMIFVRVVRGKNTKNCEVESKSVDIHETKSNVCNNNNNNTKKRTKCSVTNCEPKRLNTLKPILTINLDITSKIKEHIAKQDSKPPTKKPRTRKKTKIGKESVTDSLSSTSEPTPSPLTDSGYPSIASPSVSVSNSILYSNPATPLSSSDGYFSQSSVTSCETTSSVLSQIRQSVNTKYETYGEHIQKRIELRQRLKKKNKNSVDYKKKVLEWNYKLCSGNSTPVHNIQCSETPPSTPQPSLAADPNEDFNSIINSIENDLLINNNENMDNEFNTILSDLYAHVMDMD